ncbi:hypothetical protein J568_4555, partial [Acinetobacter baumannii 6112]
MNNKYHPLTKDMLVQYLNRTFLFWAYNRISYTETL